MTEHRRNGAASPEPSGPSTPTFEVCQGCLDIVAVPHAQACPKCSGSTWIAFKNTQGLSLEDMRSFYYDVVARASSRRETETRWLDSLAASAHRLCDSLEADADTQTVFWIRLHGVITEFHERLQSSAMAVIDFATLMAHSNPYVVRRADVEARARELMSAIRNGLSRDVQIYADWRRQQECHLWPSAYILQMTGSPGRTRSVKERSTIKSLGESIAVDEREAAIRRVLKAHGPSDRAVAGYVARRIGESARLLADTWHKLPTD